MNKLNYLIRNNSGNQLHRINESEGTAAPEKFIFQGVFTACSCPGRTIINRNGRIYQEKEMLKHIGYLRDKIKADGCILGELDHPEGRFDVSLKEASHKITDLWYDQKNHNVMGKIELLDTPNGQIARSLVKAGYPIFVSSRAAGEVDEHTHEVEIANIFTYDIVCTPGFEEARLNRIAESYRPAVQKLLAEAAGASTKVDPKHTKLDAQTTLTKMDEEYKADTDMSNKTYSMKDIVTPLNEEDKIPQERKPSQIDDPKEAGVEIRDMGLVPAKGASASFETDAKPDEHLNEGPDEEKEEKRDDIVDVTSVEKEDESPEEDDEKKAKRAEIISIVGKHKGDEEEEKTEEDSEEKKEDEAPEEDEDVKEAKDEEPKEEEHKEEEVSKKVDDAVEKAEKDLSSVDDLLAKLSKKKEAKESIISRWPFSVSLSPSNFGKFVALSESDRDICEKYIVDNGIMDVAAINESWEDGLKEEKKMQKAWLRLASDEDRKLYVDAPVEVQDAIEESAKFLVLETKADVDAFWARTGLRQRKQMMLEQAQLQERYKKMYSGEDFDNELGYSKSLPELMQEAILKSDAAYRG